MAAANYWRKLKLSWAMQYALFILTDPAKKYRLLPISAMSSTALFS
jgi:hypothetical protein